MRETGSDHSEEYRQQEESEDEEDEDEDEVEEYGDE